MYNHQLKALIAVAESGSLSKAAENLFISPTAVMKQINSLEDHLSITLFERTNQGLILTSAGESVYQDAKYLIEFSDRMIKKAQRIEKDSSEVVIRIGVSFVTPAKFIIDLWPRFEKLAPNIKIDLIPFENTPQNAVEILKNLGQQIDVVAGIYDDKLMQERGFQAYYLEDKEIKIAVPITSPLALKETIEINDLFDSGVYLIEKGYNIYMDQVREIMDQNHIQVNDFDFFHVGSYNLAAQANIPIVAMDGWENVHPLMILKPVEWSCTCPYGILYSSDPSEEVKRFISMIERIQEQKR